MIISDQETKILIFIYGKSLKIIVMDWNYIKIIDSNGETSAIIAVEKGSQNEVTIIDYLIDNNYKFASATKDEYDLFEGDDDEFDLGEEFGSDE